MGPVNKSKVCELDEKTKDVLLHKGYSVGTLLGAGAFGEASFASFNLKVCSTNLFAAFSGLQKQAH